MKILLFSIITILMLSVGCSAQLNPVPVTPQRKNQVIHHSNSLGKMPAVGSLQEIIDDLFQYKEILDKSEFETEKQYIARIRKFTKETKYFHSDRTLAETAVVFTEPLEYDAEEQTFSLVLSMLFLVSEKPKKARFGVYGAMLTKRGNGYWSTFSDTGNFPQMKIPPEKAKELKNDLRFAVIGFPVSLQASVNAQITLIPTEYIIFNKTTGDIYARTYEKDLTIAL